MSFEAVLFPLLSPSLDPNPDGMGLSRPGALSSFLNLGCGSRLPRRFVVARELAGRWYSPGTVDCGGCNVARRVDGPSGRNLEVVCWEYGPLAARRSLKDILLAGLDGVRSRLGDEGSARKGLRMVGSLDPIGAAREECDRTGLGVVFAYGLGVVRVRGLKLWPVSTLLALE